MGVFPSVLLSAGSMKCRLGEVSTYTIRSTAATRFVCFSASALWLWQRSMARMIMGDGIDGGAMAMVCRYYATNVAAPAFVLGCHAERLLSLLSAHPQSLHLLAPR